MCKSKIFYAALLSITLTTSCSMLPGSKVKCNDEDSINTAIAAFKTNLDKKINTDFKDIVKNDDFKNLDNAKLRALVNSISYTLTDTRTDRRDPDSDQVICTGTLAVNIPSDIIKNSNSSRDIKQVQSVQEEADKSNLNFDKSKVIYDLSYTVQPSDDRKKIFVALNNMNESMVPFISNNIFYALIKPILDNAKGKAAAINQSQYNEADAYAAEAQDSAAQASAAAADAAAAATDAAMATTTESYGEYD